MEPIQDDRVANNDAAVIENALSTSSQWGPGKQALDRLVAERDAALKEARKWKRKSGRFEAAYGRAMRRIEQSGGT
jgi:K+-transporting ATPase c subunit